MSDTSQFPLRRPRLEVLANGSPLAGVTSAEVSSTGYYGADRFSVSVALGPDPTWTADYWSSQSSVMIEIQMGFLPEGTPEGSVDWVSLIQGAVDTVQIDFPSRVAHLHGRDLTAGLIASRTQETFANRTASEIATILAQRHNLTPQVTATTTLVDRYYELEHDRITLNQFSRASTEWDLLVALAQQEAFEVFVEGTSLYFQPPRTNISAPDSILRPVATANGPANVAELRMERALALAGDTTVTVKSWNSRQMQAYAQTVRSSGADSSGVSQSYVVVWPNLVPEQVSKLAQNWLTALAQHERVITALMPGELSLTPRSTIAIEGTGTAFDQIYYVDSIERRMAFRSGFMQHVRAKNMSLSGDGNSEIG